MYKNIQQALVTWNEQSTDRQKLQHAYIVAMVALIVLAGLIGLINYELSQRILFIVFVAGGLFLGNLVGWALLQSLVVLPLEKIAGKKTHRTTARKR